MRTRTADKYDGRGESGQRAALFPALSEGSKEKRAVSILLACMEQVPELAKSLLQAQGAPLGKKSRLKAWTEAGPVGKKGADRPDGRIEVESTRGQRWVALLEAKIGKAGLDTAQVDAYLAEARTAGADALITISNDFAVLANHHPTYRGKLPKGINLLHWSWSSILTQCRLLTDGGEIEDRDHGWIIEHLVRFLSHPSTGVTRFDRMPASWKEISEAVSAGAGVRRGSEAAFEVAAAWIQETRDLGLQLTELLHQPVPVKLNRAERDDPTVFINRVLNGLCNDQELEIEFLIPDGVSSLKVSADLRGKTLTSSMTIGAAEDRKTAKARVNWLLRQLTKTREDGIHIKAAYGRREDLQAPLAKVREDPAELSKDDPKICPSRFEVKLITDLGRRMRWARGRGTRAARRAMKSMGSAVALETQKIYEERDTFKYAASVAPHFQKKLRGFADHPLVGEARGVGLIGAIEFVADKTTKEPFDPALKVAAFANAAAYSHGLIIRALPAGDSVAFCPPLIINEEQIDDMMDCFARALEDTDKMLAEQGIKMAS